MDWISFKLGDRERKCKDNFARKINEEEGRFLTQITIY